MATEIVKTIKPSGGDYTSLQAFMVGEARNLVTADEIAVAECYAMEDTTPVVIDGFTTDATRYIKVTVAVGNRHSGKIDASPSGYYRLVVSGDINILVKENFVWIDYLYLSGDATETILRTYAVDVGIFSMSNSVIAAGGDLMLSDNYGDPYTVKLWNNLIKSTNSSYAAIWANKAGLTAYIYNNTILGTYRAITQENSATVIAKNNIFMKGSDANPCSGTYAIGTDYNATNHSSIGYTVTGSGNIHDVVSADFDFDDAANGDYHIGVDSDAKDAGTDLSGDGNLAFSDDIDGDIRSGTWDIGADEYVSAPPSGNPWYYYAQQ